MTFLDFVRLVLPQLPPPPLHVKAMAEALERHPRCPLRITGWRR